MKEDHQPAEHLLNQFFDSIDFDIHNFLASCNLSKTEEERFLSFILSGIYYNDSSYKLLKQKKEQESFFFVLLAEVIPEEKLRSILLPLPLSMKMKLATHCSLHMREGAWTLLVVLETWGQEIDPSWQQFVRGMRSHYYDPQIIQDNESALKPVLDRLEESSDNEVLQVMELLPAVFDAVQSYYKKRNEEQQRLDHLKEFLQEITPAGLIDEKRLRRQLGELVEKLKEQFLLYNDRAYSFDQMREFFRFFGLRGFPFSCEPILLSNLSLVEGLKTFPKLLSEPRPIPEHTILSLFHCLYFFLKKLDVFHHEPQLIAAGLKRIVYGVATRGIRLERLAWLPSAVSGLAEVVGYLRHQGFVEIALRDFPILIFDQAAPGSYQENCRYSERLAKEQGALILHLSRSDSLLLAEKLGVRSWIETAPDGQFGFGGGRNCLFFLAPVIHAAIKRLGKSTLQEILLLTKEELQPLFDAAVLGKEGSDVAIHMGEDDVGILPCNFFSDAFYAGINGGAYFMRQTLCTGRQTHLVNAFVDLKTVLHHPAGLFFSTRWSDHLFPGMMKGQLSKPRFCLPLPFGHEEAHMITSLVEYDAFQQPVFHLAGVRYPELLFPNSPEKGLILYLRQFLPYSFEISLLSSLLASDSLRSIFPWVDSDFRANHPFSSFAQALDLIFQTKMTVEFKRRFWRNLKELFASLEEESTLFSRNLMALCHPDIKLQASEELHEFYEQMRLDAEFFIDFGKRILHYREQRVEHFLKQARKESEEKFEVQIEETILTKKLYLLVQCVEFWGRMLN